MRHLLLLCGIVGAAGACTPTDKGKWKGTPIVAAGEASISAEYCAYMCSVAAECTAWHWDSTNKLCFSYKTGATADTATAGFVSGLKDCVAETVSGHVNLVSFSKVAGRASRLTRRIDVQKVCKALLLIKGGTLPARTAADLTAVQLADDPAVQIIDVDSRSEQSVQGNGQTVAFDCSFELLCPFAEKAADKSKALTTAAATDAKIITDAIGAANGKEILGAGTTFGLVKLLSITVSKYDSLSSGDEVTLMSEQATGFSATAPASAEGYLEINGWNDKDDSCQGNRFCVSANDKMVPTRADAGTQSTHWALIRQSSGTLEDGDVVYLKNLFSTKFPGWLDTRNWGYKADAKMGCGNFRFCVSAADTQNRDKDSTQWTIKRWAGAGEVQNQDMVYFVNKYAKLDSYLTMFKATGDECQKNPFCVAAADDNKLVGSSWRINRQKKASSARLFEINDVEAELPASSRFGQLFVFAGVSLLVGAVAFGTKRFVSSRSGVRNTLIDGQDEALSPVCEGERGAVE